MCLSGLSEAAVAPWLAMFDEGERRRAARFAFARHRVQFIAAHALLRGCLGHLCGRPPGVWRFTAGAHGKPSAWLEGEPAPLSFNLSHTEGIAGVAAIAGADRPLGFDLEPLSRKVELKIARRFFAPPEIAWLETLAAERRAEGFLRLWTLKEAFIKATGKGLTQNLSAFSFAPLPRPEISFAADLDQPANWWFEQRVLDGGFIAALGLRRPAARSVATDWTAVAPDDLSFAGLRSSA